MELYKISQGNTLENLKHFIYITNEYGKPSSEFIDSFIENFGKTILINNFPISEREKNSESLTKAYNKLDNLWKEIEQDCKDNQTTCAYNYGSLFYYIIGSKAVSILKDTVGEQEWNSETEDNKLLYLKTFIEDFDKYITEEYQTEFDKIINTVEENDDTVVVEKETPATKKLTRDEEAAQVRAKILASAHAIVKPVPVQQVTVVTPLVPNFVVQYIKNNIHVYKNEKAIVEVAGYDNESQYFYWDYHTGELKYIPDSEHSALSVEEQDKIDLCLNTCQSNRTIPELIKENALLDADGVKTTVNPTANFIEVNKDELYKSLQVKEATPQPVEEPQLAIKHYKLKEEYNSTKGDNSFLDCKVDFNNDVIGIIVSDTEISIDNNTVDIGEYIDKNNIDINSVTIGAYWFNEVYE